MNDRLLKPLTTLVELVAKHGYTRLLFSLGVLIVLFGIPVYLWQRSRTDVSDVPPPIIDVDSEIRELLSTVRRGLGADMVWLTEYYRTMGGTRRGFDPDGAYVVSHFVRTAAAPQWEGTLGERIPFRFVAMDPESSVTLLVESVLRNGFHLSADTEQINRKHLPGVGSLIGKSFYVIGGFNLSGVMVLSVQIAFHGEQMVLTERDLRSFLGDVQTIVALLLSG